MSIWTLISGSVVGLSLGLTGGGGAVFAVPLLVYVLGIPAREAVAVSLAAVGSTSLLGFLHRWRLGQVEVRTGLLFALAGIVGAPAGTWIAQFLPESVLLLLFAGIMVIVAVRLWRQAAGVLHEHCPCSNPQQDHDGPACRRDEQGRLLLTTRCTRLLLILGVLTGVLSGLFGVGGGFIIVPALVMFSGMSIHRAVGTSLMVVSLVSSSGLVSQLCSGQQLPVALTVQFLTGGTAGLFLGQQIGRRLPGPQLQRLFSVAIVGTAAFVVWRNLHH